MSYERSDEYQHELGLIFDAQTRSAGVPWEREKESKRREKQMHMPPKSRAWREAAVNLPYLSGN